MIYFAQNGTPALIKIGYSGDPGDRIKDGDTWSPLVSYRLLLTLPGDKKRETEFHHRWAHERLRRPDGSWTDWFRFGDDIRAFIDDMASRPGGDFIERLAASGGLLPIFAQKEMLRVILDEFGREASEIYDCASEDDRRRLFAGFYSLCRAHATTYEAFENSLRDLRKILARMTA